MTGNNLMPQPEVLLPAEPEVVGALAAAAEAENPIVALTNVVAQHPSSSLAWAVLAVEKFDPMNPLESYAYARVGYHRGLDSLRKAGWRGQGPIPWSHEPNRGVLRSLYALRAAAEAIGETEEVERLTEFLRGADETAAAQIETEGEPRTPPPATEAFFIRGLD